MTCAEELEIFVLEWYFI